MKKRFHELLSPKALDKHFHVELNKAAHFSIISYNIIREQEQEEFKIRHLAENVNLIYVLSGDVHFENESIRIFVRLIDKRRVIRSGQISTILTAVYQGILNYRI